MFDDNTPKQGNPPGSLPTDEDQSGAEQLNKSSKQSPQAQGKASSSSQSQSQGSESSSAKKSQNSTRSSRQKEQPVQKQAQAAQTGKAKMEEEPEDMFAGVDSGGTAIEAGKLEKKEADSESPSSKTGNKPKPTTTQPPSATSGASKVTEPELSKKIMIAIGTILVLLILGGGGWWVYSSFIAAPSQNDQNQFDTATEAETTTQDNNNPVQNQDQTNQGFNGDTQDQETDNNQTATDTEDTATQTDKILFGEEVDTDEDQLTDRKEKELGTDPKNWDTDGDGLSDGAEVLNWETDPLNKDTDGDGYEDGTEVESGYNPKGEGKLFKPPTSTNE